MRAISIDFLERSISQIDLRRVYHRERIRDLRTIYQIFFRDAISRFSRVHGPIRTSFFATVKVTTIRRQYRRKLARGAQIDADNIPSLFDTTSGS